MDNLLNFNNKQQLDGHPPTRKGFLQINGTHGEATNEDDLAEQVIKILPDKEVQNQLRNITGILEQINTRISRIEATIVILSKQLEEKKIQNIELKDVPFPKVVNVNQARELIPDLQRMISKEQYRINNLEHCMLFFRQVNSAVSRGDEVALAQNWNSLMHTINGNIIVINLECVSSKEEAVAKLASIVEATKQWGEVSFEIDGSDAFIDMSQILTLGLRNNEYNGSNIIDILNAHYIAACNKNNMKPKLTKKDTANREDNQGGDEVRDVFNYKVYLQSELSNTVNMTAQTAFAAMGVQQENIVTVALFTTSNQIYYQEMEFAIEAVLNSVTPPVVPTIWSVLCFISHSSTPAGIPWQSGQTRQNDLAMGPVRFNIIEYPNVLLTKFLLTRRVKFITAIAPESFSGPWLGTGNIYIHFVLAGMGASTGLLSISCDVTYKHKISTVMPPKQFTPLPTTINTLNSEIFIKRYGTYNEYGNEQMTTFEEAQEALRNRMSERECGTLADLLEQMQQCQHIEQPTIFKEKAIQQNNGKEVKENIKVIEQKRAADTMITSSEKKVYFSAIKDICERDRLQPWFNYYSILVTVTNENFDGDFESEDDIFEQIEEVIDNISYPNNKKGQNFEERKESKPNGGMGISSKKSSTMNKEKRNSDNEIPYEKNELIKNEQKVTKNDVKTHLNKEGKQINKTRDDLKKVTERIISQYNYVHLTPILYVLNYVNKHRKLPQLSFVKELNRSMPAKGKYSVMLKDIIFRVTKWLDVVTLLTKINDKFVLNSSYNINNNNFFLDNNKNVIDALAGAIKEGSFNPYGNGQTDDTIEEKVGDLIKYDQEKLIDFFSDVFELSPGLRLYTDEETPVGQYLADSYRLEKLIYDQLSDGNMLTVTEANQKLRDINKTIGLFDGILTKIINAPAQTMYTGPSYTGGKLTTVETIPELAQLLLVKPTSKLDRLARQHDLIYKTSQNPVVIRKADNDFIEGIKEIAQVPPNQFVQAAAAQKAFEAKMIYEDILDKLLGSHQPDSGIKHNGKIMLEGFNQYGNEQMAQSNGLEVKKKVIEMLKAVRNPQTLLGFTPPGATTVNGALDISVHDMYFRQRATGQITRSIQNVTSVIDRPIDGWTGLPAAIKLNNGNEVAVTNLNTTVYEYFSGMGPPLEVGPIAEAMLDVAEIKTLVQNLKTETAVFLGTENYIIFAATRSNYATKTVPTNGSTAHILYEIMRLRDDFDMNTSTYPMQNIIDRNYLKTRQSIAPPAKDAIFNVGEIRVWTMTYNDYAGYLNGRQTTNALLVAYSGEPFFCFMTNEMFNNNYRLERYVWMLAHLPNGLYGQGRDAQWKGPVGVPDDFAINRFKITSPVRSQAVNGNQGIDIVVVLLDTTPAPGALGQVMRDWTYPMEIGAVPPWNLTTDQAIPNQAWFGVANVALRDMTADFTAATALMAAQPNQSLWNTVLNWWKRWYGCRQDYTAMKMMYIINKFGFLKQPSVSSDPTIPGPHNCMGQDTYGNTFGFLAVTQAGWNNEVGSDVEDCFGVKRTAPTEPPKYSFSTMHHSRRAALILGILKIKSDCVIAPSEMMPTTMELFCDLYEISCAIRSVLDDTFVAAGATMRALSGQTRTQTALVPAWKGMTEHFFDQLSWMCGVYGWIKLVNVQLPLNFANNIPGNYMYQRRYIQTCWLGSNFDIKRKESMAKDIPREGGGTITGSFINNANAPANLQIIEMPKLKSQRDFSDFWNPRINRTQAYVIPVGPLAAYAHEKKSNTIQALFVNMLLPSSVKWGQTYLGAIATFDALPITATAADAVIISTEPPTKGRELNSELIYGFDSLTDTTLNSITPLFECFDKATQTNNGFITPQIEQNQNVIELMQSFQKPATSEVDLK